MAFQTPLQKLVLTPESGSSGTGIICAFWVNGKEKKKQSSTAESESLYCCFWSWGDTRLSRSRCSFLCPQTAWPSLADSLLWPLFFFALKFSLSSVTLKQSVSRSPFIACTHESWTAVQGMKKCIYLTTRGHLEGKAHSLTFMPTRGKSRPLSLAEALGKFK